MVSTGTTICLLRYWELNWFIKEELIIPHPSYSEKWLNLTHKFDPIHPWIHQGQKGEPLVVEHLYNLNAPRIGNGITIANGIMLELILVVHM